MLQERWEIFSRPVDPAPAGQLTIEQLTGGELTDEDYVCMAAADNAVTGFLSLCNEDYYDVYVARWMKRAMEWKPAKDDDGKPEAKIEELNPL